MRCSTTAGGFRGRGWFLGPVRRGGGLAGEVGERGATRRPRCARRSRKRRENRTKVRKKVARKSTEKKTEMRKKTAEEQEETYHCKDLAHVVVNAGVHGPAHRDNLSVIILAGRKVSVHNAVGTGTGLNVKCRVHVKTQHDIVEGGAVVLNLVCVRHRLLGIRSGSLDVRLANEGT